MSKRIELKNGNYKEIHYWDAEETKISSKFYYNSKDELHRLGYPARIWYDKSGEINCEFYYINGSKSRLDGPVNIWYNKNGEIRREFYYINNKMYSKEEYNKHPEVIKIKNINRNLKLLNKK